LRNLLRNTFTHAPGDAATPETQPKGGDGGGFLTQVWPIHRDWLIWPPKESFTNGGPNGIAYLMDRWRIGEAVDSSAIADKP
jgi:hypothetical protein